MDKVLNLIVNGDPRGALSTFGQVKKGALGAKVGVAALAGGLLLAGKAAYDMGEEFDEGFDKIRVATGKTGKQLEALKEVARDAFGNLPANFGEVSTAVAEVNQRLGATGKTNQKLTEQFVELSRITGSDLSGNIKAVGQAFQDAGVPLKEQPQLLDYLFRAYQKSGTSVEQITTLTKQFGSGLRQLGLDFKEQVAMFASFEAAGVNIQTMIPGLKFALKNFLEEGKDPGTELIKTFKGVEAGTISASKAFKIFGGRATPDMLEAIKQGRFQFGEFQSQVESGKDSILRAGEATKDASERFQEMTNKIKLALEPAVVAVYDTVGKFVGELGTLDFKSPISGAVAFGAAIGGTVIAVGYAISALSKLRVAMLANPWTAAALGIGLVVGALISLGGEEKKSINIFKRSQRGFDDLRNASARLRKEKNAARNNTANLRQAEQALINARKQYGPNSQQAIQADQRVNRLRARQIQLNRQIKESERLVGAARKAQAQITLIDAKKLARSREILRIQMIKENRQLNIATKNYKNGVIGIGDLRKAQKQATDASEKYEKKNREVNKTIRDSANLIGPKYASNLEKTIRKVQDLTRKNSEWGRWLDRISDKSDKLLPKQRKQREEIAKISDELKKLPKEKQVKVVVDIVLNGLGGEESLQKNAGGGTGDGWGVSKGIDKKVKQKVQKAAKEDPMKFLMAAMGGGGSVGPHSPGAWKAFIPFANKFGLSLTSGYRPGSITSSGNASYHSMNRAGDFGGGAGEMLSFAKFMARAFGSQLRELIHTPLGFSIKDGAVVAPYAQAEHYDHVHVAYQKGGQAKGFMVPGQGTGDTVPLSIMAEPNESVFVLNRNATKALGKLNALNNAIPRFQKGGGVTGRVTWFNGGETAGGSNTSRPGLALNLHPGTDAGWNNDTTQGWMDASRAGHPVYARVSIGGKTANLPITDLGPAGWTGNAIDVTEGGLKKLGYTTSNFPSGTTGTATILGSGGAGGAGGGKGSKPEVKMGVGKGKVVEYPPMKAGKTPKGVKGLGSGISKLFTSPYDNATERRANVFAAAEQGLEIASQTGTLTDDRKLNEFILGASKKRKAKVNKEIETVQKELTKKRLSPKEKKKLRGKLSKLQEERGELQGRIGTSRENLEEISGIGLRKLNADVALARAEGTSGKGDDVQALQTIKGLAEEELARAEKSGDPREIAEATRNLTQATQDLKDAAVAAYTEQKDAEWALAQLTESKEDDIRIANERKGFAEQELAKAQSEGNWAAIQHWAEEVKSWSDTAKDLQNAVEENSNELKALREEMELNRRIAESEAAVSGIVARRALADMISGQLGPRAHHRAQVAGPGTVSRY